MSDLAHLVASTEEDEGFKAQAYLDTERLWSAGDGRCLETHPLSGAEWKYLLDRRWISITLSRDGASWLMTTQLLAIERQLEIDYLTFWPDLNDARQNVLIEWAYQLGVEKEEAFHVAIQAVREGRWADAKAAMLDSLWAKQTPQRVRKLAEQMFSGEFQ